MTDTAVLYRTLVRLAAIDDTTVTLVIPATSFDQLTFRKDDVQIPRWLLDKEIDYRFHAKVPILAERPEQISLWNCENDPRSAAEQRAAIAAMVEATFGDQRADGEDCGA